MKTVRLLCTLLRSFATPASIGGGDGKWQDTNPNLGHD